MADVEDRIALNVLLDFYGPLLTPHKREILRLYCEEDLSLQEIADQLEITRQGVHDAVAKGRRQLADYEDKLGLAQRHRTLTREAEKCLEALNAVQTEGDAALSRARSTLENMLRDA